MRSIKHFRGRKRAMHPDISEGIEFGSSKYMKHFWIREITAFHANLSQGSEEHLDNRRRFLVNAIRADIPRTINFNFLSDPKSFLEALKFESADRLGIETSSLCLSFHFGVPEDDDFLLEGLYLMNGTISLGLLCPTDKNAKPFTPLENVRFRFVTDSKPGSKKYLCPMFKRPIIGEESEELGDGPEDNFVTDVAIETKKGDRFWLLNCTAIYISVPEKFL
jgi:hypothetical protein